MNVGNSIRRVHVCAPFLSHVRMFWRSASTCTDIAWRRGEEISRSVFVILRLC